MSDFLKKMVAASAARVQAASDSTALPDLIRRATDVPTPIPPRFNRRGFDVIAEIKRRSPSEGTLVTATSQRPRGELEQSVAYTEAGALAISVLTEPDRFAGDLAHIEAVKAGSGLPVMRKDFLVDPYQIWESRAHRADGVLIIVKIVDDNTLIRMLNAVRETGMFVLLEAFDRADLERIRAAAPRLRPCDMIGLNSRDLDTLEVRRERFAELVGFLPTDLKKIAESGLTRPADVALVAALGFDVALVGTALMRSPNPGRTLSTMLRKGRGTKVSCT